MFFNCCCADQSSGQPLTENVPFCDEGVGPSIVPVKEAPAEIKPREPRDVEEPLATTVAAAEEATAAVQEPAGTLPVTSPMETAPAAAGTAPLDFPLADTYTINLKRAALVSVGLTLDLLDNTSALITAIKDGAAVACWNSSAPMDERVGIWDRIIKVNDVDGDAKAFAREIAKSTELTLVLRRRCKEFDISIEKGADTVLGLDLDFIPTSTLLIQRVCDGGPIAKWNEEQDPKLGKKVVAKDRIVAVNGNRGQPGELLVQLKDVTSLTLTILPFENSPEGN